MHKKFPPHAATGKILFIVLNLRAKIKKPDLLLRSYHIGNEIIHF